MGSSRGQSTVEYVGAILLIAVVLLSAAVVVAAPGVPATVVAKLRLGLCIVGGDICTPAQAAARGLEPCEVGAEEHTTANGVDVWVLHAGGTDVWAVTRYSDGSVVLSESNGQDAAVTTGVRFLSRKVGSADAGLGFTSGRAWRLSRAAFERIMTRSQRDPRKLRLVLPLYLGDPDEVFTDGGGEVDASVKLLGDVGGRAVLGRRKSRDGTTYYVDLGTTGGELVGIPGHILAEYRTSAPPVLSLRGTTPRTRGEETETVLRLPLRDAADRELARRVAFTDLGDPSLALRDLASRIRNHGTIERSRYRVEETTHDWDHGIAFGLKLGARHLTSVVRRTLLDAEVLDGATTAGRKDCVGA